MCRWSGRGRSTCSSGLGYAPGPRIPARCGPLGLMVFKEFFMGVTGFLVIQKTGKVFGADWHGKVNTWLLYAMMILHVFWYNIPDTVSKVLIAVCVIMMTISLVLYARHNMKALKEGDM